MTFYQDCGVSAGDRVLTLFKTSVDAYLSWLGLGWLGAIEVPTNPDLKGALLEHVVRDAEPALIVLDDDCLTSVISMLQGSDLAVPLAVQDRRQLPALGEEAVVHERPTYQPSADGGLAAEPVPRTINPWDTTMILYTSGTTGPPKGVVVNWGQFTEHGNSIFPEGSVDETDSYYCPLSVFHVSARTPLQLMANVGGRVVIHPRFSVSQFWTHIHEFGCTSTLLMGAMALFLWRQEPSAVELNSPLRNVLMAPLIPQASQMEERFGFRVCSLFGMTELANPLATGWDRVDDKSCGTVRGGHECRLVDSNDCPVPDGEVGELVVRHDEPWKLATEYWKNPTATASALRNQWFHTGDLMIRNSSGDYYYSDRLKDSIRRRGENISSFELEREVASHPSVFAAAAVGVQAEDGDQDVRVFVILKDAEPTPEPATLIEYLRGVVPSYMVPKYLDVVEEFPLTPSGKIRKADLKILAVTADTWDSSAGAYCSGISQEVLNR